MVMRACSGFLNIYKTYCFFLLQIVTCYKGFTLECKDSYARLLEEDEEEGHYLQIYSVVCHPDNPSIFASAGLDSNIKVCSSVILIIYSYLINIILFEITVKYFYKERIVS